MAKGPCTKHREEDSYSFVIQIFFRCQVNEYGCKRNNSERVQMVSLYSVKQLDFSSYIRRSRLRFI